MDINGISSSAYSIYESTKADSTNSTNSNSNTKESTASGRNGGKPDANQIVSMLTSKLGLNDNQVIDIKRLIQKSLSEDPSTALQSSTDGSAAKKSMDAKMEQLDSDIESLLSDDQKAAYEKLVEERKNNAPAGGPGQGMPPQGGGAPPSATDITSMLTSKLSLNDNQQLEIKSLIQQSMKSAQNSDSSDRDSAMQKLNDNIKSLLTSDQATAFEKLIGGE